MALIGYGDVMMGFRLGLTSFLGSADAIFAVLVGLFYAGLCVCTTLIFLDRRENTFCMPMHCGSSMLSGFTASYALAWFFNQRIPNAAQLTSAGFIVIALGFLSPLHHFQRTLGRFKQILADARRTLIDLATGRERSPIGALSGQPMHNRESPAMSGGATDQEPIRMAARMFLFVCSGNTCRSPMAAAIANAEIAARLGIPFEALETVNVHALSAGIAARTGASLTPEAQEVLRSLNVPVRPHAARNLTFELADQAEMIFCMTSAHRKAVLDMLPSVAWKTYCLDAESDIEDPIGMGLTAYINCAERIRSLVRMRFEQLNLGTASPAWRGGH
jgi:protein-tyrosine-phosphatase